MKPMSDMDLRTLRTDFDAMGDELKELEAFVKKHSTYEASKNDVDFHLLCCYKSALETLHDIAGTRLMREYAKRNMEDMNARCGHEVMHREVRAASRERFREDGGFGKRKNFGNGKRRTAPMRPPRTGYTERNADIPKNETAPTLPPRNENGGSQGEFAFQK